MNRAGVLVSVLALGVAALSGCSGRADERGAAPEPTSSASGSASGSVGASPGSATASDTPYLPVPEGVELTAQGSALALGDEAVVAFEPRQGSVGVLSVAVQRIEQTTFKRSFAGWRLGDGLEAMTPYFVRARLTNEGETDLGGRAVPLYAVDAEDTLIEASTFKGTFKPCPSKPFPKPFPAGTSHEACLVYLAPQGSAVSAVAFRPAEEFVPISWTGRVTRPQPDQSRARRPPG